MIEVVQFESIDQFQRLVRVESFFLLVSSAELISTVLGLEVLSSQSSSGQSMSSSLFSRLRVSIRSQIVSCWGMPKVYLRQQVKARAARPKRAEGNQEFTPNVAAICLTKGDIALPSIPTTLVQPKPMLLTQVGYSSATQTKKIDQKQHSTNLLISSAPVSSHFSSSRLSSFQNITITPSTQHKPEDTEKPITVAFFLRHLSISNSAEMQPTIYPTPNRIWLVSLLNPTLPWLRVDEQYIAWIPKNTIAPEMEVHRMLLNLKRSKTPKDFCSGCSSCLSSQWSRSAKSSWVISWRLLTLAILLRVKKAIQGCFLRQNIGVYSRQKWMRMASAMKRASKMYIMALQLIPV